MFGALKAALRSNDSALIRAAKADVAAHFKFVRVERGIYHAAVARSSERPAQLLAVDQDIMDQKKTGLPHFGDKTGASLSGSVRMPLKLLGLAFHSLFWDAFLAPPWVPKGANLTCTALWAALLQAKERGIDVPPVLYLQVDGGSENWNAVVLAFCALLVSIDIFERARISHMPVGHTHGPIDQLFSHVSGGFHGRRGRDTGRDGMYPEQWCKSLGSIFKSNATRPTVVDVGNLLDFDSFLRPHMDELSGYGATADYMVDAGGDGPAMLDAERRSKLFVADIRKVPGTGGIATLRFAESMSAAEAGEFFPAPLDPDTLKLQWCPADKPGFTVLNSLPTGSPAVLSFASDSWDKKSEFEVTLAAAARLPGWPVEATRSWRQYLSSPPSGTAALAWGGSAFRASAAIPAAPPQSGQQRLVVDPVLTNKRGKSVRDAELVAAGAMAAQDDAMLDLAFDELEVGDYALAFAPQPPPPNSVCVRLRGHDSPPLELLQVVSKSTRGNSRNKRCYVKWRYFEGQLLAGGELRFRRCVGADGHQVCGESAYAPREMLLVFQDAEVAEGASYTLPEEQRRQLINRYGTRTQARRIDVSRRPRLDLIVMQRHEDDEGAAPRGAAAKAAKPRARPRDESKAAPAAEGSGRAQRLRRGAAAAG